MKTPKPIAVVATQESALSNGIAAGVLAAASAAIPPNEPMVIPHQPPTGVQMAAASIEMLTAGGAVQEAQAKDGLILNEFAAQKLGLKRRPLIEQKVIAHKFAHYQVWGKGELLGTATKAVDESDAIGQMVQAYKIVKPEQWMFQVKKVPGSEYVL